MTTAIIVSAGSGQRMGEEVRKQYLLLGKHPILVHTLQKFNASEPVDRIILVLPQDDVTFFRQEMLSHVNLVKPLQLVGGGRTRQESVCRGLRAVESDETIVLIHDGVRPFVTAEHIATSIETAVKYKACTLAIPADDTLKKVDPEHGIVETLPRNNVWYTQTPQTFHFDLIRLAHGQALRDGYAGSDDAALVERLGQKVRVICGSRTNFKITNREDLVMAQALLALKQNS
jgi:2-C-methyl-D-erythritol 4-phosphate cytidylyltransferase